jgi:heparin binding hemagglutinin HbhA
VKIVEDVRKTVSNPKPLYFAAGVGEAAVEALKDAPARLGEASAKASEVATEMAGKVAGAAETVQSKIALGQLDPKALRDKLTEPDLRAAREKAQNLLLAQVGRALEVAGKAVETYDGYSERGKVVVDRVLAGRNGIDVEVVSVADAVKAPAGRIVVEEITVVEEPPAAPADVKADVKLDEPKPAEEPKKAEKADEPKPAAAAAKKPAAPRRTANARKKSE